MADDEEHALSDFLRTRLEAVGLDYDTYGPYVFPLLTDSEADAEEWDSVLELLQASSESHSDDDHVWLTLRADIQAAWATHQQSVQQQEEQEHLARQQQLSEALAEEKRLAEQAAEQQQEAAAAAKQKETPSDDAAKRALLDRFGYEDPEANNEGNGEEGGPVTNKQVAAQAAQEKQQELRSQKGQTKKDEQAKTAKAKMDKARLKEERRKKTTRGERRRG